MGKNLRSTRLEEDFTLASIDKKNSKNFKKDFMNQLQEFINSSLMPLILKIDPDSSLVNEGD